MKVRCHCPCHTNPNIEHVVACCNNGWIEDGIEIKDESPIKEESQDELWKVVSKIIHSTHRMEDALGKLNCQFHITRKTPNQ